MTHPVSTPLRHSTVGEHELISGGKHNYGAPMTAVRGRKRRHYWKLSRLGIWSHAIVTFRTRVSFEAPHRIAERSQTSCWSSVANDKRW
jgi:hypothetical protein